MKTTDDIVEARCTLGARIRALRKEQNLSQSQLGLMVDRDRTFISRVERGQCSATFDSILLLAYGLGMAPAQLLDGITLAEGELAEQELAALAGKRAPSVHYRLVHF